MNDVVLKKEECERENENSDDYNSTIPPIEPKRHKFEHHVVKEEDEFDEYVKYPKVSTRKKKDEKPALKIPSLFQNFNFIEESVIELKADSKDFENDKLSILKVMKHVRDEVKYFLENPSHARTLVNDSEKIAVGGHYHEHFSQNALPQFTYEFEGEDERLSAAPVSDMISSKTSPTPTPFGKPSLRKSWKKLYNCICCCCIPTCLVLSLFFIGAQVLDFLIDFTMLFVTSSLVGNGTVFYFVNGVRVIMSSTFIFLFCSVGSLCCGTAVVFFKSMYPKNDKKLRKRCEEDFSL